MNKKLLFLLWLLFFSGQIGLFAQKSSAYVDSLTQILDKSHDTIKVAIHQDLCFFYLSTSFEKAFIEIKKSLTLSKKIKYWQGETRANDVIGSIYVQSGDYATGLQYKLEALKIYEKKKDVKGIATICNNIGVLYFRKGDYDLALKYYEQAYQISKDLNDENAQAIYTLNIGEVYQMQGKFEKAIEFEKKTLQLSQKKPLNDNTAYAYGIIGKVYEDKKEWKDAENYYQKALDIFIKLSIDEAIIEYLFYLSRTYLKQNNSKKALELAKRSLQLAKKNNEKTWEKQNYELLGDIYAKDNNFNEAFKYQKIYLKLRDSLVTTETQIKTAHLQTIYDSDKKQAQIDILTRDKEIQNDKIVFRNLVLLIVVFVLISVAILSGLLFRNNRQKQKTNKELMLKNQEINQQKEEILTQRDNLQDLNEEISAQKDEIEKINHDIIDSINYAQNIQKAILPVREEIYQIFPEHFILFKPRDIVSGDFYWFQYLEEENKTFLAAVDCTGHGVPGAFMSMLSNQLLYEVIISNKIYTPNLILEQLRIEIRRALHQSSSKAKDGMDISLVCIDHNAKKMHFSGAGNPLIYFQNNELNEVKGDISSIGGTQRDKERAFTTHTIDISLPTIIYLFSDGFQDQFGGERGRKFMYKYLKQILTELQTLRLDAQEKELEDILNKWRFGHNNPQKQIDDILMLGVKIS
ncbi:MAG: tetratricopeptide repeat protein [Bacteroidetes bacterium]|nr:MAG: tetratricopeptide repeat protein [Bacteroidota bacterium]TAG87536.1 MAG: tetratricopeptide repeat protein [Bacteroidota bacterium]